MLFVRSLGVQMLRLIRAANYRYRCYGYRCGSYSGGDVFGSKFLS